MNNNTILSLDIIVTSQILLEYLEQFQRTPLYRQRKVNLIKSLIKELEKDTEDEFNKAFGLCEDTLMTIQNNYEYALKSFAVRNIPNKIVMAQLMMAYEKDPSSMEANIHRILKKNQGKIEKFYPFYLQNRKIVLHL